jgi:hypothetical protein
MARMCENQDDIIGCEHLSIDAASGQPAIEGSYGDGEPWRQRTTFDPNYPDVADSGFAWEPVGMERPGKPLTAWPSQNDS